MLRSVLVALDGSPAAGSAGRLAIGLAGRSGAHLTALGIVNASWFERSEPVPLGGMAFKSALELELRAAAQQRVTAALHRFDTLARESGLTSVDAASAEGDVLALIGTEATSHDLVILSRNSHFEVDGEENALPNCADRLVRAEPRPIILVPERQLSADEEEGPVLVAYDASAAASRALHMFALLGLAERRAVHVISAQIANSEAIATSACRLLSRHGAANPRAIGIDDAGSAAPADIILDTAKAIGAGMIVMGAYGHHGIRELFGSCTRSVLEACPVPVFLHH